MDTIIKSLSHKLVKLDLEKKSLPKRNAQGKNRGYNPQYIRPPLQILHRERKYQLDQIPPPLYLEDGPGEQPLDTHEMQGNLYSSFSEEEEETMAHHEMCQDREATINEKAPIPIRTIGDKEREVELGGVEKGQFAFNLQKELEKVKIHVPLIELLTHPTYKAQIS